MNTLEFYKIVKEIDEVYQNHNDFYELAEKYGFLAPWSPEISEFHQSSENYEIGE